MGLYFLSKNYKELIVIIWNNTYSDCGHDIRKMLWRVTNWFTSAVNWMNKLYVHGVTDKLWHTKRENTIKS